MAKEETGGVWRTIGGRRVFIKDGQSLADAMKESGKFSRVAKNQDLYKKVDEENKKINELVKKEEKKKDISSEDAINDEAEKKEFTKQELKDVYGTDDLDLINAGRAKEDRVSLKEEKQGTVTTASGTYTFEEMQKRDKEVKDLYKAHWNDEMSAKELNDKLNEMREKGRLSYGEQSSLQYDASLEYDKELEKQSKEKETKKDQSFVQENTQYGGTREYSSEEVKKMEDAGVKPMKSSYSGSGWEGVNSRKNLSTSEQAKAITDEMKEKYPDVKIARKSDVYSGGSSIDFNIMSSDKDIFLTDADIDKMTDFGNLTANYEFERWAKDNVRGWNDNNRTYTTDDQRKYAKEVLNNIKKRDIRATGDEWFLNDYGKKLVSDLNKTANSYTYDDSDAMVDYFNHGTYMWVSIGKWNKPYEVSSKESKINSTLRRKGYEKYLKEHPNSKMTFEEFKDQK